jgi:hypothetical protein
MASPSRASSSPGGTLRLDDFLVKQATFAQKKLTAASVQSSAERSRGSRLEQELMLERERGEEASATARREAAARLSTTEAASRMARERDAALAAARRAGERAGELEAERAATKRVLLELYAANAAVEAENRSLHATLGAREAALRAAANDREAWEAERLRLGALAGAAKEVARQSMGVAAAAEGERDAAVQQVARLRMLLKRANEAALSLGITLPQYITEE